MSSAVNFSYAYRFASTVAEEGKGRDLKLATFGGLDKDPYFFDGRLRSPRAIADILLALSAISRTRFFSPGLIRERMLAAADPVVTCDGERLRFEVFSVCCGVYARFDLSGQAIDGSWLSKGTTNVDFNPPMRAAMASLSNSDKVDLKVGVNSVELSREEDSTIERKVKLPVRWLRSFVEVQAYQTMVKPAIETDVVDTVGLDILIAAVEENHASAPNLAHSMAQLVGFTQVRWLKSLREVAKVSALHAVFAWEVLTGYVLNKQKDTPLGFLELMLELAEEHGFGLSPDAVQALEQFTGAGKTAKLAKSLALEKSHWKSYATLNEAAQQSLRSRASRVKRWHQFS